MSMIVEINPRLSDKNMVVKHRTPYVKEFHIGDDVLIAKEIKENGIESIVSVKADGRELEHIIGFFKNIPSNDRAVNTWRGDLAKFILENW